METNRNFFITIALSIVILTLWQVFYMNPKIEAQREQAQIEATRQGQTRVDGQASTPAGTTADGNDESAIFDARNSRRKYPRPVAGCCPGRQSDPCRCPWSVQPCQDRYTEPSRLDQPDRRAAR